MSYNMNVTSALLGCSFICIFLANILVIVVINMAGEYDSCKFDVTPYIIANMLAIDFTVIYMAATEKFVSLRAKLVSYIIYMLAIAFQVSMLVVDVVELNADCVREIRRDDAVFVTLLAFPFMHGISIIFLACVYPIMAREFWQNLKRMILDYNGN